MALGVLKFGSDQMTRLGVKLATMGGLVEHQFDDAITAFEKRDLPLARGVIARDKDIDDAERQLDEIALELLSSRKLSSADLRIVITTMKMASDLERIGDLARNVAARSLVISEEDAVSVVAKVARMGRIALRQLSDALNALTNRNSEAALAVWGGDQEIDELYNSVFREILTMMTRDPGLVNACTHLMFVAKNFERAGDHVTNLAEQTYYRVTGDRLEEARPKSDMTSTLSFDYESGAAFEK